MKITDARFVTSVATLNQLPRESYPQIAFAGRSNVGKSSSINALLNRRKLAQTSSTPGKTRLLNFFLVNQRYFFVDLPGYGYAKASKTLQQSWLDLIESYLKENKYLRGVVQFIDLRHRITPLDLDLLEWLNHQGLAVILVGTKADKLSGNGLAVQLGFLRQDVAAFSVEAVIPFSAHTGRGKNELWQVLSALLREPAE
ncbi:YihA family ribosome biogenesis GTP-binding protein [candidate division KSB1 bacterium]|nr:YihA family ribosome biogenesis GTP-binding protein [candidate division KSB1 bacterium]